VIAAAIVVHGYVQSGSTEEQVNAAVAKAVARLDAQRIDAEVANRMQIDDVKQMFVKTVGFQRQ
jgi:hypothetical protein